MENRMENERAEKGPAANGGGTKWKRESCVWRIRSAAMFCSRREGRRSLCMQTKVSLPTLFYNLYSFLYSTTIVHSSSEFVQYTNRKS